MSLSGEAYRVGKAADDRQVLVTPRFNITWSPSAVEAGGAEALTEFRGAFAKMLLYLTAEHQPATHGPVDRMQMLGAFSTLISVDGSGVTYADRNTRYTNIGGTLIPEAIQASLPMDAVGPSLGGIRNPLNYPEPLA